MRKQQSFLADEFFTDEKVAINLIKEFNKREGFTKFDLIVEPSAGNGSFYNNLPSGKHVIGIDLTPRTRGVIKHDFLTWKHPTRNDRKKTLCIGNPPFGINSAIASAFVDKCALFADHIVMILPVSYKHLPQGYEKQWSIKLPPSIFVYPDGNQVRQSLHTKFIYFKYTGKTSKPKNKPKSNGLWERIPVDDRLKFADLRVMKAGNGKTRAYSKKDELFDHRNMNPDNNFYISLRDKRKTTTVVKSLNDYKWNFDHNTTNFHSVNLEMLTKALNSITSS